MISKETLNNEKELLRARMRSLLQRMPPGDFRSHQEVLLSQKFWRGISTILLYSPLPGEPNPVQLMKSNLSCNFFFPRIEGDHLGIYRYEHPCRWRIGPFDLKEPDPDTWELVSPEIIDLALIPGLAFDSSGGRLGRGAGFYDRLLGKSDFKGLKIGVCWESQIVSSVPCDAHDIPMDHIISEKSTVTPRQISGSGLDKSRERE